MTQSASADESTAAPSDLPPPYENATSSNSEQTPLVSYSDEKTHPSDTEQDALTNRIPINPPKTQGGWPSRPSQPSHTYIPKHASKKWSSTPKRVSCIAPSIVPGRAILRTRCFHSKSQHLRLALATSTTVQVYDAMRDSLLWELHSNSSQLVQGNEEPLTFGEGFRPSPDGSLLCVIASGRDQRRLLIVDSETGWVKLEASLSATDGNKPHISPDNTTAVLCHSGSATDSTGHFKIFSLIEEQANVRRVRFEKPASWQAMGIRFAPDSKHIIACAGPTRKAKDAAAPPSVSVCVYDVGESGRMVRSTSLACSPKFNSASQNVDFAAEFHFPSLDEWLVSFPDYSSPGKTCIVNARLGQTVAVFSSELTLSQKWQAGVQSPGKAQVAHDAESGIFTRMELSNTILPRGQTVTITKFALSANGGREKSVVRKPFQIRAVVLSCKHADVCGLSPDGSHMFVQQGAAGKVEMLSLAM